jgi:hypothetical protein
MKRLVKPLLLTTALVTALAPVVPALAGTEPAGSTPPITVENDMLATAPEALSGMANIQAARLALAIGDHARARLHLTRAMSALSTFETEETDGAGLDDAVSAQDPVMLPFSVAVVARALETPAQAIAPATGDAQAQQAATDANGTTTPPPAHLRNAEIVVASALLPVDESMTLLVEAAQLIDNGDYAAADLALHRLEQGVVVRTIALDELLGQGGTE